ncbi:MAG: prepilin-type N-terminal cleavage/methylation domain-containing protein [Acidimicrobiales bacterium]
MSPDERGFSLVELMVVVALLGVVLTMVLGGFATVQTASYDNLARQHAVQQASLAMQVVGKDIRATADDPATNLPLISGSNMTGSSLTFDANIDTTANPAAAGSASAYNGCPDQVTITGSSSTPGPITESRTHPDNTDGAPACSWPAQLSQSNTYTQVVVPKATLSFEYLTYVDPTSGKDPPVSSSPATTASIQVTITVPPSNGSAAVAPAQLVQTVPLATVVSSNYLTGSN